MNGSGPHLYCEISNNSYGFIKEYDGPFEIKDNYIIVQIGINKFIYFEIIEKNNIIFLVFDENKSDLK